ncbi:MAG: M23 family metallopeptidase [Thermoleophilaceae bacterium]
MFTRTLIGALLGLVLLAPPAHADAGWVWPVRGDVITPYRNGDDPYAGGQHRGIDIAAAVGTDVVAAAEGVVSFAGVAGSSGVVVSIATADGRFDTSYLHLSSVSVRKGDRVAAGDRIGAVGTSGKRSAEQPHLHFGVRAAGSDHDYRDPLTLLPPRPPAAPAEPERPVPVAAPVPVVAPPAASAPVAVRPRVARPRFSRRPVSRRVPGPFRKPVTVPLAPRAHIPIAVARATGAATAHIPTPRASAGPAAVLTPPAHHRPATAPKAHRGVDYGWLAACAGLIAAATLLGRPERARAAGLAGRSAVRRLRARLAS